LDFGFWIVTKNESSYCLSYRFIWQLKLLWLCKKSKIGNLKSKIGKVNLVVKIATHYQKAMQTLPKERRYETLSYLPPLTDAQIAKQIQYILNQGYIPAIEFNETSEPTELYWTMWKLPLFGAKSTQEVLGEVQACRSQFNTSYIRVVGFDNIKQCQILSFLVHKPNKPNRY